MAHFINQQLSKLALMLCTLAVITACKKNDANTILTGNYTGSYTFSEGGFAYWHGTGKASVNFTHNNTFTASNLTLSPVTPTTAVITNGNYTIKGDSITFSNAIIPPGTGQTTTLALTGKYQYHFEGDSLIITRSYSLGELSTFSQYRLKRN